MVAAVRAGYGVTAIDAFADQQTVALADNTILVDYDAYGFNADALLQAVSQLEASQYLGFIYGSGFEAQPSLLKKIATIIPLIGNTATTVQAVKTAASFFAALDLCAIPHPASCLQGPLKPSADYLDKFAGGCGGTHISLVVDQSATLGNNHYYQQKMNGRSISLLFVAYSHGIEVVGFNEQWLNPTVGMPFRYGGALSRIEVSSIIQQQMIDAAEALTRTFSLRGCNSLDALIQDDIAYVLEINPRLSATFDLYRAEEYQAVELHLMEVHIQASLGGVSWQQVQMKKSKSVVQQSKAHAVIYALEDMLIPTTFSWPDWVLDSPCLDEQAQAFKLLADAPICSVQAQADDADVAKCLLDSRVEAIKQLLGMTFKSRASKEGVYAIR